MKTRHSIFLLPGFCLALAVVPCGHLLLGQTRSSGSVSIKNAQDETVLLYSSSRALVIGVASYASGWPPLPGVRADVGVVKKALELQGFTVDTLMDPTHERLEAALDDFVLRCGQDPDGRMLFYFAGHGYTHRTGYGEEIGYVVPVDAPDPLRDMKGFRLKALDMAEVEVLARRIEAKHALFLFDACFAGSIFDVGRNLPVFISQNSSLPVRQFVTSGSADETVPDRSIFREQLVRALDGEADADRDGYVTGTEIGYFLQSTVVNYSRGAQHPQYGKIRNPSLDKGEFVFVVPQTHAPAGKDRLLHFPATVREGAPAYTEDEKAAILLVARRARNLVDLCRQLQITEDTLVEWSNKFLDEGIRSVLARRPQEEGKPAGAAPGR
ncbi:MAG: caspase family protein [Bacteroidota bacterium]